MSGQTLSFISRQFVTLRLAKNFSRITTNTARMKTPSLYLEELYGRCPCLDFEALKPSKLDEIIVKNHNSVQTPFTDLAHPDFADLY
jgi:hypothetical protein